MFEYCNNNNETQHKLLEKFIFFGECINNNEIVCNNLAKHEENFFYFQNCASFKYINYIFTTFVIIYILYTFYKMYLLDNNNISKKNYIFLKLLCVSNIIDFINNIIFLYNDKTSYIYWTLYGICNYLISFTIFILLSRLLTIQTKLISRKNAQFYKKLKDGIKNGIKGSAFPYIIYAIAFYWKINNNIQIYNIIIGSIYIFTAINAFITHIILNFIVTRINSIMQDLFEKTKHLISRNSKSDFETSTDDESNNINSKQEFKDKTMLLIEVLKTLNKNIKLFCFISIPCGLSVIVGFFIFGQALFFDFCFLYTQTANVVITNFVLSFIIKLNLQSSSNKRKSKFIRSSKDNPNLSKLNSNTNMETSFYNNTTLVKKSNQSSSSSSSNNNTKVYST